MTRSATTPLAYPRRWDELEERFAALEPSLGDSPEKRAISLLHGMLQEVWRNLRPAPSPRVDRGLTLRDVADLYRSAPRMEGEALNVPLPVGTPAPDFALPDARGATVRLSDFRGRTVVLVFYPLDWSPGCSQQLDLYQQERAAFEQRGAQLLGVSVDSIYSHGAWAAVRGIGFPLLSDFHPKGEVARRYRVWREPDGFSERALYVVDRDGVIRYAHVSPFLHHVPDIYELLATLDRIAAEDARSGAAAAASA
ncbi:MAG TPA: peroxiredoxin [Gemmatimonadales bacterium]|nr:peroxiredoxin [Gemmatimonadales bacterium]